MLARGPYCCRYFSLLFCLVAVRCFIVPPLAEGHPSLPSQSSASQEADTSKSTDAKASKSKAAAKLAPQHGGLLAPDGLPSQKDGSVVPKDGESSAQDGLQQKDRAIIPIIDPGKPSSKPCGDQSQQPLGSDGTRDLQLPEKDPCAPLPDCKSENVQNNATDSRGAVIPIHDPCQPPKKKKNEENQPLDARPDVKPQ
jgi:hypothetical protein